MTDARPRQLLLDLPLEPKFGRDDFLVGAANETAFDFIERWPDWPAPMLVIAGPQGSGKSHLAAIWAEKSGATVIAASGLGQSAPEDLATCKALALEDMDAAPLPETGLFHLVNLLRERHTPLVMTARTPPGAWRLTTPDLLSRLRLAPVAEIAPPDDAMLRALMVKLFVDRQIMVDIGVIDYMLARIERSFAGVAAAVAALDREALVLGRRITRAVAAGVLRQDQDRVADDSE